VLTLYYPAPPVTCGAFFRLDEAAQLKRPRREVVRAGASLPEITLGGSNRAAAIILLA
jgi:hypothetical protein